MVKIDQKDSDTIPNKNVIENDDRISTLSRCVFEKMTTFLELRDIASLVVCSKLLEKGIKNLHWQCKICNGRAFGNRSGNMPLNCNGCEISPQCSNCVGICQQCLKRGCSICFTQCCDECGGNYCDDCKWVCKCSKCDLARCPDCKNSFYCEACEDGFCCDCETLWICHNCDFMCCMECNLNRLGDERIWCCSYCDKEYCEECNDWSSCPVCERNLCQDCKQNPDFEDSLKDGRGVECQCEQLIEHAAIARKIGQLYERAASLPECERRYLFAPSMDSLMSSPHSEQRRWIAKAEAYLPAAQSRVQKRHTLGQHSIKEFFEPVPWVHE